MMNVLFDTAADPNAVRSLGTPSDLTVVVEHLREELGLQIDLGGLTSDA